LTRLRNIIFIVVGLQNVLQTKMKANIKIHPHVSKEPYISLIIRFT
jgi:hypothetical protein